MSKPPSLISIATTSIKPQLSRESTNASKNDLENQLGVGVDVNASARASSHSQTRNQDGNPHSLQQISHLNQLHDADDDDADADADADAEAVVQNVDAHHQAVRAGQSDAADAASNALALLRSVSYASQLSASNESASKGKGKGIEKGRGKDGIKEQQPGGK